MTKTDYHEYDIPTPFDIDERNKWGGILNDALDQLDDDIILRGTLAERPDATQDGRLFLATDNNQLYLDDGSTWNELGSQMTVKDSGATIITAATDLDFDSSLNVTNPNTGTAEISVVDSWVDIGGDTMTGPLTLGGDLSATNGETIWDESAGQIPQTRLENDTITVTAGDGLKNGGSVSLGGTTTLDVEPADFAGFGLQDDGTDDLEVNQAGSFTWTSAHDFTSGSITVPLSPSGNTDAAPKEYVDSVASGLALKEPVVAATDGSNIDLTSATDPNPIDGVNLSDGDRVLLKDQTDGTENGIYVASTATDPTTWSRSDDFDEDSEAVSGAFTFVEQGTNNANRGYVVTTPDPITLGTTSISWGQFSGAGQITAGDGIKKSGDTLNIEPADFAGTFLSDDGSDNLTVNLGVGVENDGGGSIRLDEDYSATWTTNQTFNADILDAASNIVYDQSNNWVPQARVEQGPNSGLDADTVDGEHASALKTAKSVFQASSTDTSTDINTTSWVDIAWDSQITVDSGYTHDSTNTPAQITFDDAGTYHVDAIVSYDVDSADVSVGIKIAINGSRLDTFGQSGAVSNANSNTSGSTTLQRTVTVSAGDTMKIQAIQQGNAGTATMRSLESVVTIDQIGQITATLSDADTLDGVDSTGFVRADGSTTMSGTLGINLAGGSDFVKFQNTDTNDEIQVSVDGANTFSVNVFDASASSTSTVFDADPTNGQATFPSLLTAASGVDAGASAVSNVGSIDGGGSTISVNDAVNLSSTLQLGGDLSAAGGETIWDESATEIPDSAMGTIANSTLANSSVTVAGNTVSLGSSTAVSVTDLSDVSSGTESAGHLLIWNGTNAQYENASLTGGTEIAITQGDASVTIDLDTPINLGADTDTDLSGNDLTDGATVIWDTSVGEIPDSAMGTIANSTLANSSVTVAGNSVSLGGSTAIAHGDLSDAPAEAHHSQIQFSNGGTAVLTQPTDVNFGSDLTLSDDGDGTVTIDFTGTAGHSVSDSGTQVLSNATDVNFGTDLSVTDDGDGTVTVDAGSTDPLTFDDSDSDGVNWEMTEDASTGHLVFNAVGGGGTQMDLEHNGNLRIEGELTEGAAL